MQTETVAVLAGPDLPKVLPDTRGRCAIERLPESEYGALARVEEGFIPDPEHSIVIAAKCGGEIVGRVMLIRPFHIEGTWVDERFRKTSLPVRLFGAMEREAKKAGIGRLFSYADNPQIEGYLGRLGYTRTNLTVWQKDI